MVASDGVISAAWVNAPAATVSAEVIFVLGKLSCANCSQDCPAACARGTHATLVRPIAKPMTMSRLLTLRLLFHTMCPPGGAGQDERSVRSHPSRKGCCRETGKMGDAVDERYHRWWKARSEDSCARPWSAGSDPGDKGQNSITVEKSSSHKRNQLHGPETGL